MKKIILLLLADVLLGGLQLLGSESYKVVEKSEKKLPEWVGHLQDGELEVTAEAPTLQQAKDLALTDLQRKIVMAVATNVSFATLQHSTDKTDGTNTESLEEFESTTRIQAANLPFIKGVSLTEATATYWELVEEKKTGRRLYRFTMLYPLSDEELTKMRREFTATDNEKMAEMSRLKAGLKIVSSATEVREAEATLAGLETWFTDEPRRKEAATLAKRYGELYSALTWQVTLEGSGRAKVVTLLDGRPFSTGVVPKANSDCASQIQVNPGADGSQWVVTFSTEDCLPLEDNALNLTLNLKNKRLSYRLPI